MPSPWKWSLYLLAPFVAANMAVAHLRAKKPCDPSLLETRQHFAEENPTLLSQLRLGIHKPSKGQRDISSFSPTSSSELLLTSLLSSMTEIRLTINEIWNVDSSKWEKKSRFLVTKSKNKLLDNGLPRRSLSKRAPLIFGGSASVSASALTSLLIPFILFFIYPVPKELWHENISRKAKLVSRRV